jgi:AcrR family transcriptional regulator
MEINRTRLLAAARKAFAEQGYAEASMDVLTAEVGLTRGALYHQFGDKKGLLAAVVDELDEEMAKKARQAASGIEDPWQALEAEGVAYIKLALDPEVQRIVLMDGPAFLGDPSTWPSQNRCLQLTLDALEQMQASGILKALDPEAAARLLNGAAMDAASFVAASSDPASVLPKAIAAFKAMASGLLRTSEQAPGE